MTPARLALIHAAAFRFPRAWSQTEFAEILQTRGVFVLGDARGFVMGRSIAQETELLTIAVHPDHRRMGLGRRLLRDFEARAARDGAKEAFLEVAAGNNAAVALNLSAGWTQIARRRGYYAQEAGAPEDALILRRGFEDAPAGSLPAGPSA